jgi:cell division septation protein DedD
MITVRAGSGAIGVCLLLLAAGCSREQQDWRSAEAADTIEAYGQFIQRHPESELATQARTRVAQLGEDRDWQHAGSADTVQAYRDFIAQHPNGKWAQEAHIRIENFSLGEQAGTDAASRAGSGLSASRGITPAPGSPAASPPAAAIPHGSTDSGSVASPAVGTGSALPSNGAVPPAVGTGSAIPLSGGTSPGMSAGSTVPRNAATPPGAATPALLIPHNASPTRKPTGFGIQLGAFSTEAGANTEWHLLTSRFAPDLRGLQEHVVPAETPSGRIYRLQAAVGNEGRARSICDSLRKHGQACVAVLPH